MHPVNGKHAVRFGWLRRDQRQFVVGDMPTENWEGTNRGTRLSFVPLPIIRKTDKVFTMGSCFAREVRYTLHDIGFELFPKYHKIEFDQLTQKFRKLSVRGHVNHYNTFTIRQEFELAFGGKHYALEDFVDRSSPEQNMTVPHGRVWQDPYRRNVYALTGDAIMDLSRKIDLCMRDGIFQSDVYVLTLGLTEVWRNDRNGLYANQVPDNEIEGKYPGFTFERSSYEQNFDNMRVVCALLAEHFPEKKIIMTVSPVPLKRTFSGNDVVIANMESKSILRAVAAALSTRFSNVIYWPSYEMALMRDLYEEDGRHVTPKGVRAIMEQFLAVHLESCAGRHGVS